MFSHYPTKHPLGAECGILLSTSTPDLGHQLCSSRPRHHNFLKSLPFPASRKSPRSNVSFLCDVQGNIMNAGHKLRPGTAKRGYVSAFQAWVTYLADSVSSKARCSVEYDGFHWSRTQVIAFRQACLNNCSEISLSLVLLTRVITGGGFSISVVGSNGKGMQNGKRLWKHILKESWRLFGQDHWVTEISSSIWVT